MTKTKRILGCTHDIDELVCLECGKRLRPSGEKHKHLYDIAWQHCPWCGTCIDYVEYEHVLETTHLKSQIPSYQGKPTELGIWVFFVDDDGVDPNDGENWVQEIRNTDQLKFRQSQKGIKVYGPIPPYIPEEKRDDDS